MSVSLIQNDVSNLNKILWKLKTPLKIKIFLWYLRREIVLAKDNLANLAVKFVVFVTNMKRLIIYFMNVTLLDLCGS
jgi:hypothetical protein